MQTVSTEWKEAQLQHLAPESFVEVTIAVVDPDAQADATTITDGEEYFSNAAELASEIEKSPEKYATLEKNIWILDGSFNIIPDSDYGEQGYIGDTLCDDNGEFESYPTITIAFSQVFTALVPGITINWGTAYDNEWATEFTVTAYHGENPTAQKTITDNTTVSNFVELDINEYDKLVIQVAKWTLPHHRARIQSVYLGVKKMFTKSEIMSYTHTMVVDPLSATLPKAEIVFSVANVNGEYNPDNSQGTTRYLMERQPLTAKYGYKLGDGIEWIDAGTFYLSQWSAPQNGVTTSFTARDALEFMEEEYTGITTGTLYDVAESAFLQASLPKMESGEPRWEIDDSLKSINAPADVDLQNASIMVVLQWCANAACSVLYQDRKGKLHIEPLSNSETDYSINRFNSYENSNLELSKQLKSVNVNNGQYVLPVGNSGVEQPISNPFISDSQAPVVARWAADYLINRQTLTGAFRADPRLDPLDKIANVNQFSESAVLVTDFQITFNGAFRGSYTGRRIGAANG